MRRGYRNPRKFMYKTETLPDGSTIRREIKVDRNKYTPFLLRAIEQHRGVSGGPNGRRAREAELKGATALMQSAALLR